MSTPYLEISPRQSGKTHRLLTEAHRWVMEQHSDEVLRLPRTAIIVCSNPGLFGCLRDQLANIHLQYCQENGQKYIYLGLDHQFIFTTVENLDKNEKGVKHLLRRFFDDFDNYPVQGMRVRSDDYFCTTPNRLRKTSELCHPLKPQDLLVWLWAQNGYRYQSFNPLCDKNKDNLPDTQFYLEYCGMPFEGFSTVVTPLGCVLTRQHDVEVPPLALVNASIAVVIESPTLVYIEKNQFGRQGFYLPHNLVPKFFKNPNGRLVSEVDWE